MDQKLGLTPGFWLGRRVLVTGHTGFKGGWLSLWLQHLGAEVHGYALHPPTEPNLFGVAGVAKYMASSGIGDIRDRGMLSARFDSIKPEIVFHLAAQPLVRRGYRDPVETYATNVMGTVHVLEAARAAGSVKAVVNVTSDKCYAGHDATAAHFEDESLGGPDPYSSSKACAELVTAAYRASFLAAGGIAIATARAGNVIGGGDWAGDRLLPDCLRAIESGTPLTLRHPEAIRPWQHVLEPLQGYLLLAEKLHGQGGDFAEAWNFGPLDGNSQTVANIVEHIAAKTSGLRWTRETLAQPGEAICLRLDSHKARSRLGWQPRWSLTKSLDQTLIWHRKMRDGSGMREVTLAQIDEYCGAAEAAHAVAEAGDVAL